MGRIRGEKPKVYLVAGYPASGKSSLTKVGNTCLNADVVCLDDIYGEMLKEDFLWRNDDRIYDKAHEKALESLSQGRNVMLDSVYMDEKSRAYTIDALKDKADIYMISVDTPIEVCKERNRHREHPVEDWVYNQLKSEERQPTLQEGFSGIYHFDNLTDTERNAYSGYKIEPLASVMREGDREKAIAKVRNFLDGVAADSGVKNGREIPDSFLKVTEMDSKPKTNELEY